MVTFIHRIEIFILCLWPCTMRRLIRCKSETNLTLSQRCVVGHFIEYTWSELSDVELNLSKIPSPGTHQRREKNRGKNLKLVYL